MKLIASLLELDRKDMQALKIKDAYALHKIVYSLFDDVRSAEEKKTGKSSGFLYAEHGGDYKSRKILLLSNRMPHPQIQGQYGRVTSKEIQPEFLQLNHYRFKVIVNPVVCNGATRKIIPVKGRENVARWFADRCENWGFKVSLDHLQVDGINVQQFAAQNQSKVTIAQSPIQGVLEVTDRQKFIKSFSQGIGRGRAFGCGLLQIAPIIENPFA